MTGANGEFYYIEDDLQANALTLHAEDGLKDMETYLAKYLAFTRFMIERAWEDGDTDSLRELGELEPVPVSV